MAPANFSYMCKTYQYVLKLSTNYNKDEQLL